jgi:hypothetical protein
MGLGCGLGVRRYLILIPHVGQDFNLIPLALVPYWIDALAYYPKSLN